MLLTFPSFLIIGTALNGLMNLPYALQLAYGWTKLVFYGNIVAVIVLVPMILSLVNIYGALGAAIAWIILNSGYVLIAIQIMHSRLLKGEQWRWYLTDVGKPFLAALTIALLWRMFTPAEMSRYTMFFSCSFWSRSARLSKKLAGMSRFSSRVTPSMYSYRKPVLP